MSTIPKSQIVHLSGMVEYQEGSVVSRQVTKSDAGMSPCLPLIKIRG